VVSVVISDWESGWLTTPFEKPRRDSAETFGRKSRETPPGDGRMGIPIRATWGRDGRREPMRPGAP
jgi:hypothetical protein